MNDIAAIRARREAVTPEQLRELRFMANCHNQAPLWGEFNRKAIADVLVERDTLLAEVERLTGERDALTARFATQNAALAAAVAVRERALARCAAVTAERDEAQAEVERLTVALHDDAATKLGDAMLEASRLRRELAAANEDFAYLRSYTTR